MTVDALRAIRNGQAANLLVPFLGQLPPHAPVAVTQVKNEARYLPEWIAYHSLIGIRHFVVFDNDSSDDTPLLLNAVQGEASVLVVPWPRVSECEKPQLTGLEFFLNAARAARSRNWAAFIDCDEFIMLARDRSLPEFLARFEGVGGIALNWMIFGSAGHAARPNGLVVESYLWRAELDCGCNRHVKSILRLDLVEGQVGNGHYFGLKPGARYCFPDGTAFPMGFCFEAEPEFVPGNTEANASEAAIFHYVVKSREDWAVKKTRGRVSLALTETDHAWNDLNFDLHDRNDIEDRRLAGFGPAIRARMVELGCVQEFDR